MRPGDNRTASTFVVITDARRGVPAEATALMYNMAATA